jgi:hypothetical protein
MKFSVCVLVCCLAIAGCTVPRNATPLAKEATMVAPAVAHVSTTRCQQVKVNASCDEWTPLQPQPSFADVVRLLDKSDAPTGMSWGGLYLCGAFHNQWLIRFLGEGYYMVVLNKFICRIYSRDGSSSLDVYVGDGTLDDFADVHLAGAPAKERTEIMGRDAVRYTPSEGQYFASHDYILGIPDIDHHVLVVDISFGATPGADNRTVLPDPDVAQRFADQTAALLIAISA